MHFEFAEEDAINDLVMAIQAGAPGPAFDALDRLVGDQDNADVIRERISAARARRR
ncbi:hypothetical protein [Sphingomonas aurantiaca]|uniref:hypothetical protein n=1 Tax=Sphingomonas aurantiaca TaxID=185949 RepID=UPI0018FE7E6D|nr:hypothetical protein [Sphingomonas aurantiaca]